MTTDIGATARNSSRIARGDTLSDLAAIIRSKNAGPYRITLDILFRDRASFERVRDTGTLSRESIARAYGIDVSQVTSVFVVEMGLAIKATLLRPVAQGDPGESDMYGCQQHAPLLRLPVR